MKSTNKAQRLKNETTVIPPLPAVYRDEEGDAMPTKKQIDAILPYLDRFTGEGFSGDSFETVSEFHQALYDHGWIVPFDWGAWQETAQEYVENPAKIESTDAETIQKLFTIHFRMERFCEGHLAAMFENGHIVHLLRRLRELRNNNAEKRTRM